MCLTFNKQIDYFTSVYTDLVQQLGSAQAQDHISKSIFSFIIGSNDILAYTRSSNGKTPQQLVDSMITTLRGQLKVLIEWLCSSLGLLILYMDVIQLWFLGGTETISETFLELGLGLRHCPGLWDSGTNLNFMWVDDIYLNFMFLLQTIYNLGARKFAFVGTGLIGCCPSLRVQNGTECNSQANSISLLYNQGAASLLKEMKSELSGMSYSFFNSSLALQEYLQNPSQYGMTTC